jgi:phosphoribosyl 1,2-cyclic phosphodiesterase
LGVAPQELTAVLITHEHTDHIAGLATLTKKLPVPIYATAATGEQLCLRIPAVDGLLHPLEPGQGFDLGALWCQPFATPHDAAGSVGYALTGKGGKMALCTDLGHLTPEVWQGVAGADLLIAETNHDEDWVRSGPYPYHLKQRILGDFGHLSNETGSVLVQKCVEDGARTVLLAHLSAENNTPAHARAAVERHLRGAGIDPQRDLTLAVAPRAELGQLYRLEQGVDVRAFDCKEAVGC